VRSSLLDINLRVGSWHGTAHNYYTRVEVKGIEKHSSLLRHEINYNSKKFYGTGKKLFFNEEIENALMQQKQDFLRII
jgi:hypothetical protein